MTAHLKSNAYTRVGSCRAPDSGTRGWRVRRDNNTETYWQSDGPQPHLVNIQFHKKAGLLACAVVCLPWCALPRACWRWCVACCGSRTAMGCASISAQGMP